MSRTFEYCKKSYLKKRPDNSGVNNPAHKARTTEKQRRERSVMCIEYYQKKYPDKSPYELVEIMNNKINELKIRVKNSIQATNIQYWINKGYSK